MSRAVFRISCRRHIGCWIWSAVVEIERTVVDIGTEYDKPSERTYLVDDSRALKFFQSGLHPRKCGKDCLRFVDLLLFVPEELEGGVEYVPCTVILAAFLLELGPFYPYTRLRSNRNPSLVDLACAVPLFVPLLYLDVRLPRLVIGLPSHPSLEDLARARDVLEQFF